MSEVPSICPMAGREQITGPRSFHTLHGLQHLTKRNLARLLSELCSSNIGPNTSRKPYRCKAKGIVSVCSLRSPASSCFSAPNKSFDSHDCHVYIRCWFGACLSVTPGWLISYSSVTSPARPWLKDDGVNQWDVSMGCAESRWEVGSSAAKILKNKNPQ